MKIQTDCRLPIQSDVKARERERERDKRWAQRNASTFTRSISVSGFPLHNTHTRRTKFLDFFSLFQLLPDSACLCYSFLTQCELRRLTTDWASKQASEWLRERESQSADCRQADQHRFSFLPYATTTTSESQPIFVQLPSNSSALIRQKLPAHTAEKEKTKTFQQPLAHETILPQILFSLY